MLALLACASLRRPASTTSSAVITESRDWQNPRAKVLQSTPATQHEKPEACKRACELVVLSFELETLQVKSDLWKVVVDFTPQGDDAEHQIVAMAGEEVCVAR